MQDALNSSYCHIILRTLIYLGALVCRQHIAFVNIATIFRNITAMQCRFFSLLANLYVHSNLYTHTQIFIFHAATHTQPAPLSTACAPPLAADKTKSLVNGLLTKHHQLVLQLIISQTQSINTLPLALMVRWSPAVTYLTFFDILVDLLCVVMVVVVVVVVA